MEASVYARLRTDLEERKDAWSRVTFTLPALSSLMRITKGRAIPARRDQRLLTHDCAHS